ncbi:MAG: hypothetical protein MMC33_003709, partial [Icmadophila ericetorum]|nr:hypothetical protein [Icmadophila ericetorum]
MAYVAPRDKRGKRCKAGDTIKLEIPPYLFPANNPEGARETLPFWRGYASIVKDGIEVIIYLTEAILSDSHVHFQARIDE